MGQMPTEPDLSHYAGRWVALIRGRVVGQGGTPDQANLAAKISRHKEIPQVIFVPRNKPFEFSPILERVRSVLPEETRVYLVGGAVRDAMRSKPVHDYDFVVQGDALRLARRIADKIKGAYFPLDEERSTARVIYTDGDGIRTILDFAAFRGSSLEMDLKARDFTINAMAVDLQSQQALLDPLGGASDLWHSTIRVCSNATFLSDPLRILRAIRMAAGFGMRIHRDTRVLMRESVHLLPQVSSERLRDELFIMLGGPQPHTTLRALEMIGALPHVLPELVDLKGVDQSPPHTKDVWEHTLATLKNLDNLLELFKTKHDPEDALGLILGLGVIRLGKYRDKIVNHLQKELVTGRSLRSLLFMAGLYHDIAKPQNKHVDPDGRIRFFNHENVGAEIMTHRAGELNLSNKEVDRLAIIIRNHMRPAQLARIKGGPSAKAIYRYFRDTGDAGVDASLLSLADILGTYGPTLPQDRWDRQLEVVRSLFDAWWEKPEKRVSPPTIITGHDLLSTFNLEPGPQIGELLESVREAQITGEVENREDAIRLVGTLIHP